MTSFACLEGNKQRKAQIHFVHSQPGTQFQFTAYLRLSAEFLYKLLKTSENKPKRKFDGNFFDCIFVKTFENETQT